MTQGEGYQFVSNDLIWLAVPIVASLTAGAFATILARWVLSQNTGNKEMQEVAGYILEGAQAFLRRQYQTIGVLALAAAVVIGAILALVTNLANANATSGDIAGLALRTAFAFLIGAACSGLAGYIGMLVAVRSNLRVASAASRSLGDALQVALRGGAVTGFLVIALSLLGVTLVYIGFGGLQHPDQAPTLIVGFGFGASFVALFAQLGGGIYTKAADVGADLVGKVVSGLPEDSPRNPAVIADLVGDNVGDCAGRGADLFESTAAENIGAMILGSAVATTLAGGAAAKLNPGWIILPLVAVGFGIFASIIGVLTVRSSAVKMPRANSKLSASDVAMRQLNLGFYVTAGISAIAIVGTCYALLHVSTDNWWYFALAGLVGIANTFAFVYITQYYTSGAWRPVREIANSALTGPATTVISGLAVGFENTGLPVLAIAASLGAAYALGSSANIGGTHGVINTGGVYGTAVATVGMLMSVGYILAMDSFGPITDNAGGIVEMSDAPESVREVTDALDSVGNTTKALTKGYGIGSASLAAFLLIFAYLDVLANGRSGAAVLQSYDVNIVNPPIFIAGLIGAALVFVFSSLALRAVSTAAQGMIKEVLRQFAANPLIIQGKAKPDYDKCVDISTRSALRQMVTPGILVVATPIFVGVVLGPEAAAGMLVVGTITGVMMALVMNNGGAPGITPKNSSRPAISRMKTATSKRKVLSRMRLPLWAIPSAIHSRIPRVLRYMS